jgi:hypothetical protein
MARVASTAAKLSLITLFLPVIAATLLFVQTGAIWASVAVRVHYTKVALKGGPGMADSE